MNQWPVILASAEVEPGKPKTQLVRQGMALWGLVAVALMMGLVGLIVLMRWQRRRLLRRRGPRRVTSKISAWEVAGQRAEPATVDLDPPDDEDEEGRR
jgi:hypothetical protein